VHPPCPNLRYLIQLLDSILLTANRQRTLLLHHPSKSGSLIARLYGSEFKIFIMELGAAFVQRFGIRTVGTFSVFTDPDPAF